MTLQSDISSLRLCKKTVPKSEIVHYADENTLITSWSNMITVCSKGTITKYRMPQKGWKRMALLFRLTRRALRLDKMNVVPLFCDESLDALVVIRQGNVYRINVETGDIQHTLKLRQCRNVLHQSICTTESGYLFFGEYGSNRQRQSIPVYRSTDQGRSWHIIYEFPAKSTRHVHGCYWDRYEKRVWVCTGDFQSENHVLVADDQFESIEKLGDGSQRWRTCYPFFEPDHVFWGMDSQLETCYVNCLKRSDRTLTQLYELPGPVWYGKKLSDGIYCIATANEIGEGVKDDCAHLLISRDAMNWYPVMKVRGDIFPKRFFKFGVIGFADGQQSSDRFYLFAEALRGHDGKSFMCKLVSEDLT